MDTGIECKTIGCATFDHFHTQQQQQQQQHRKNEKVIASPDILHSETRQFATDSKMA